MARDIPPEMLANVVRYVRQPSDLRAICLASSNLRTAALPHLYESMTLDNKLKCWPLVPGSGMLKATNPGLAYARRLKVKAYDLNNCEAEKDLLRIILQLLPRNSLRGLNCDTLTMGTQLIVSLFTQQMNLSELRLGAMSAECVTLCQSGIFGQSPWSNLTQLYLPVNLGHASSLNLYSSMVRQAIALDTMVVRTRRAAMARTTRPLHDTNTIDGLIFDTLFSTVDRNDPASRIVLRNLALQAQPLFGAERTITNMVDFTQLRQLSLFHCEGYSDLLATLRKSFKSNCSLKSFSIKIVDARQSDSLSRFLTSFRGLERLFVEIELGCEDFPSGCLSGHQETLKALALKLPQVCGCTRRGHLDLFDLFQGSPSAVINLGTELPRITLEAAVPEALQTYEDALAKVLALPALASLRIYNWPEAPEAYCVRPTGNIEAKKRISKLNHRAYLSCLDDFLAVLFERLGRRLGRHRFPTIYFGAHGTQSACDGETHMNLNTICYHAVQQQDVFGRTKLAPARISLQEASYIELDDSMLTW